MLLKNRFIHFVTALALLLLWQTSALAEDRITLNLKDADIRALISTVSKFTGKNFIVDPRVKANVTVVSSKTMSSGEVYQVFLSILQVHGFAAIPTGSIIKIVPEANAKSLPTLTRGTGDELITRVLTMDHVAAAQLVPILRPLVPQQGHLAAYNPSNTLIITDYAANISRLQSIISAIDKEDTGELEIIQLKYASATELVRIITTLKASTPKAPDAGTTLSLAADERTNSILLNGERSDRIRVRATIAQLDTPTNTDTGNTSVIYLKYAKAEDIMKVLTGVQKGTEKNHPKAAVAAPAERQDFDIQSDTATNALIITAGPDVMQRMRNIIRQLDIRRAQVLIESIIAEISENKSKDFSSQFVIAGKAGATNSTPIGVSNFGSPGILGLFTGNPSTISSSLGNGINIGVGRDSGTRFGFLLRALSADGSTNILSTPSIVTLDNQEAQIVVGQNVPFITGSFTNTGGGSSGATNPFQTIERKDVGITLKVTPQVNDGDTIKLDIDQEISNLAQSAGSASDIITNKRTLKTSVLVENGEILVLGGLIDDQMRDTEQKVPVLGDIPLLGALFRSQITVKEKQNLMIFMRPSLLPDSSTAQQYTSEKYNFLRAQQMQAGQDGFGLLGTTEMPLLPEYTLPIKPKAETPPANPKQAPATEPNTAPVNTSTVPVENTTAKPEAITEPKPEVIAPMVTPADTTTTTPAPATSDPAAATDSISTPAVIHEQPAADN